MALFDASDMLFSRVVTLMSLVVCGISPSVNAALRSVHGVGKIEAGLPDYYLADEIRRVHDGMMIAIPPAQWLLLAQLDLGTTGELLKQLAGQVELSQFRSHP
ncbi:hypothetical protein IQ241_01595 [Romeria aff. gracilis LEGE 07310]|uniref:Uncharacterized protein n=1 Tax=Vasconcelosia minhoensis LEGE 07310 TaxID=915328 RepID=A0A8J7A4Y7_9CYAN|nr:hypothetical protein [Romeria gracilis]MBE9076000.1 hypothetical protein [Romeria aff. gracilis LEGE 07310]